jgi:hypothetical protein
MKKSKSSSKLHAQTHRRGGVGREGRTGSTAGCPCVALENRPIRKVYVFGSGPALLRAECLPCTFEASSTLTALVLHIHFTHTRQLP